MSGPIHQLLPPTVQPDGQLSVNDNSNRAAWSGFDQMNQRIAQLREEVARYAMSGLYYDVESEEMTNSGSYEALRTMLNTPSNHRTPPLTWGPAAVGDRTGDSAHQFGSGAGGAFQPEYQNIPPNSVDGTYRPPRTEDLRWRQPTYGDPPIEQRPYVGDTPRTWDRYQHEWDRYRREEERIRRERRNAEIERVLERDREQELENDRTLAEALQEALEQARAFQQRNLVETLGGTTIVRVRARQLISDMFGSTGFRTGPEVELEVPGPVEIGQIIRVFDVNYVVTALVLGDTPDPAVGPPASHEPTPIPATQPAEGRELNPTKRRELTKLK